ANGERIVALPVVAPAHDGHNGVSAQHETGAVFAPVGARAHSWLRVQLPPRAYSMKLMCCHHAALPRVVHMSCDRSPRRGDRCAVRARLARARVSLLRFPAHVSCPATSQLRLRERQVVPPLTFLPLLSSTALRL